MLPERYDLKKEMTNFNPHEKKNSEFPSKKFGV
jgi:hypothetical protein